MDFYRRRLPIEMHGFSIGGGSLAEATAGDLGTLGGAPGSPGCTAGAAGVGYFLLRLKGYGFGTSHFLVGLHMFAVGGAAAAFFLITK